MKRFFFQLLIVLVTFRLGLVAYDTDRGTAEAQAIHFATELHEAERTRNADRLKLLSADTLLLTWNREPPRTLSRDEFADKNLSFEGEIVHIDAMMMSANAEDDRVTVNFWMKMTADFGEDKNPAYHIGRYQYVLERQSDDWKLVEIRVKN